MKIAHKIAAKSLAEQQVVINPFALHHTQITSQKL